MNFCGIYRKNLLLKYIKNGRFKQVYYPKSDGALRGVPAEGVADKQQSVATCLGARGKPSPLNKKACYSGALYTKIDSNCMFLYTVL